MKYWQEDLLGATEGVPCEHTVFKNRNWRAGAGIRALRLWTARCTAVPQSQNQLLKQLRRVMVGPVYQ